MRVNYEGLIKFQPLVSFLSSSTYDAVRVTPVGMRIATGVRAAAMHLVGAANPVRGAAAAVAGAGEAGGTAGLKKQKLLKGEGGCVL